MRCLDVGDADGAAALVAPDVVWNRQGQRLVGPQAVREVILARTPERLVRHHLSNIVVRLESPETASSVAYYSAYLYEGFARPGQVSGPERVGDYFASYAKLGAGWRIAALRAERLFTIAARE